MLKDVNTFPSSFFCSVRFANWSFLGCEAAANSFTRNCTQFCELWVCCLNFCIFGLYISVSEKYARRAAQWSDTFIHHWRLTASDRFPRTHSSLSVLVTPQLVRSVCVCVFPTSSMMPQIELNVNVIWSPGCLYSTSVHVPETSVYKGGVRAFLSAGTFWKIFFWSVKALTWKTTLREQLNV